jgi:hypothetical protein
VSGGSDSTVVIWEDSTAADAAAAAEEQGRLVLRQQELANALHVRPAPSAALSCLGDQRCKWYFGARCLRITPLCMTHTAPICKELS